MDAGNGPVRRFVPPSADELVPLLWVVGGDGFRFDDAVRLAPPDFDAGVAHVRDEEGVGHVATSAGVCRSHSTMDPTSFDNPCPVTADTASTGRASSRSIRSRTSSLPVNSHLLTAITSGLPASAALYSSNSRRMVR